MLATLPNAWCNGQNLSATVVLLDNLDEIVLWDRPWNWPDLLLLYRGIGSA
jgi:hypothetical protein